MSADTPTTPAEGDAMADHIEQCRERGFPFCDTCQLPAVWSEFFGWRHSTPDFPFGLPLHHDDSGHEATAKDWWSASPAWSDRASTQPLTATAEEA